MTTRFEEDVNIQCLDVMDLTTNNITLSEHSMITIGEFMITGKDLEKLLIMVKRVSAEMFPEEFI